MTLTYSQEIIHESQRGLQVALVAGGFIFLGGLGGLIVNPSTANLIEVLKISAMTAFAIYVPFFGCVAGLVACKRWYII